MLARSERFYSICYNLFTKLPEATESVLYGLQLSMNSRRPESATQNPRQCSRNNIEFRRSGQKQADRKRACLEQTVLPGFAAANGSVGSGLRLRPSGSTANAHPPLRGGRAGGAQESARPWPWKAAGGGKRNGSQRTAAPPALSGTGGAGEEAGRAAEGGSGHVLKKEGGSSSERSRPALYPPQRAPEAIFAFY